MGFTFKHYQEDAPVWVPTRYRTKHRHSQQRASLNTRPKTRPGTVTSTGKAANRVTWQDQVRESESLAMAAARTPTAVVVNPALAVAATRITCPPSWFAEHLPGHESDLALWASALPDQESDLHVPLQRVLMEKLHMVSRLTRWKERVVDGEQADKRASTAASALAASGSNAAADEVAEAKAAVSRFEDAAFAAWEKLDKATEDSSESNTRRVEALSQISAETSRDLAAAQRRLREAKAHTIDAANLVRADAAARAAIKAAADAAADAAAVAAADAEADAEADARAAGIDEPAIATSAEIRAAITRAKAAVACYLGIDMYCISHISH